MFDNCTAVAMPAHTLRRAVLALSCLLLLLGLSAAQQSATVTNNVPNLVKFSGTLAGTSSTSGAPSGTVGVIFALYTDQTGGAPLWQEVQNLTVDANGRYATLLGSGTSGGIPVEIFSSNEAHWLGLQVQGQAEQPRVLLVSVPYALKAADSETLGGLPASAFLRADASTPAASSSSTTTAAYVNSAAINAAVNSAVVAAITITPPAASVTGALPYWTNTTGTLGNSNVFYDTTNSNVGIGIAAPVAALHILGTNPTMRIEQYGPISSGDSPNFNFYSANGTSAANATGTLLNDNLGQFAASGYIPGATAGTGTFPASSKVKVNFTAIENWDAAHNGTAMSFQTTPLGATGSTARKEAMRLDSTGLTVDGNITVALNSGGGIYFQDGSVLATAMNLPSTSTGNTYTGNQTITGSLTTSGTVSATGNINVDQNGLNTGRSISPGLLFGASSFGGGDGIASAQQFGSPNQFGLDFYTNNTKQMSITNGGSVGIATQTPAAALEADTNAGSTYPVSVFGEVPPTSATGLTQTGYLVGVWGDIGGSSDSGAGVLGTADENYAGYFANKSTNSTYPALYVENDETANSTSPVFQAYGEYNSKAGTCIITVGGGLTCTGAVATAVAVSAPIASAAAAGGTATLQVALHAVQSPENWFEDFGSGKLSGGTATVQLDATFAQTVNTGTEYHVFLTPKGDCKGLYLAQESASSFEVRESGGGLSNVAFDYRIVAKRAGFESARLEDVTEQVKKQVTHYKHLQVSQHSPSAAAKSVAAH